MDEWREALQFEPGHVRALQRLAWALATCPDESLRNGAEAVRLAELAQRISGGQPVVLDALAAAYAETGKFDAAIRMAEESLALADARNDNQLADAVLRRIELYRAGEPYRDVR
jgi:hypothetical protein